MKEGFLARKLPGGGARPSSAAEKPDGISDLYPGRPGAEDPYQALPAVGFRMGPWASRWPRAQVMGFSLGKWE